MSQGSRPPRRSSPRDPYRAPPHAEVPPGAFPAPGQVEPAPSWKPPESAGRASPSKRGLVVSRPSSELPPAPGLLAQGFETTFVYGDAAGEHLAMVRGDQDASLSVWIAFVAQIVLFGAVPGYILGELAHLAGMTGAGVLLVIVVFTLFGGAVPAWLIFRDRWCCIEAFASRWAVPRLGVLYVPVIALVYANVRGVKKLAGK